MCRCLPARKAFPPPRYFRRGIGALSHPFRRRSAHALVCLVQACVHRASFHCSMRRSRSARSNNSFRSSPAWGRGILTRCRLPAASKSLTVQAETPKYPAVPCRSKSRGSSGAAVILSSVPCLAPPLTRSCGMGVTNSCPSSRFPKRPTSPFRGRPGLPLRLLGTRGGAGIAASMG